MKLPVLFCALSACLLLATAAIAQAPVESAHRKPSGPVRLNNHSLTDDSGPFLGLGVSHFTALWRAKHDRARLEADLAFLAEQGFNYYRMLSMVGHHASWKDREIAPITFTTRDGRRIEAWPDYWRQLGELIDLAFDRFGLRTQITIFADGQLMPDKRARLAHLEKLLSEVVPGREHKILLLEVANEAWQNGFPGELGVAELREYAKLLGERTAIPVAITSNHDGAAAGVGSGFDELYAGGVADIATWHFSRDRRSEDGWRPVFDCWELGDRLGFPPVSSNEPIGPGSSVDAENDPVRLAMAAAFAYTAKLPMYVFHSAAGVQGRTRFEDTPGIGSYRQLKKLLPADLPNWQRHDGLHAAAPLTVFAAGQPNRYWSEAAPAPDGCLRNIGSNKDDRFVCVPIGIRPAGLRVEARHDLSITAYHPVTGKALASASLRSGDRLTLPAADGALILLGRFTAEGSNERQTEE